MRDAPEILILYGGPSAERAVSLRSGQALAEVLAPDHAIRLEDLTDAALPGFAEPKAMVVFPALHGAFGEDGQLQTLLEAAGFAYAGSDATASRLCMDKPLSKVRAAAVGVPVLDEVVFSHTEPPAASDLIAELGTRVVLKPAASGSSIGLRLCKGTEALTGALRVLEEGQWLAEPLVQGREFSVGILDNEALGVVEICPRGHNAYDYAHKYEAGATEYYSPARISESETTFLRDAAVEVFRACRCRDFARADFLCDATGQFCFLEMNTLPGLTPTSLLPKSASACGLDFKALAGRMLAPALKRFHHGRSLSPAYG